MMSTNQNLAEIQPLTGFNQTLTYRLSPKFKNLVQVGTLVQIPLGSRRVLGIVFSLAPSEVPPQKSLKFIIAVVQEETVLTEELIRLARWITSYYAASMESVLEAMIPAAIREGMQAKTLRTIAVAGSDQVLDEKILQRAPKQRILYEFLTRTKHPVDLRETLNNLNLTESVAVGLVEKGLASFQKEEIQRVAYDDDLEDCEQRVQSNLKLTDEQKDSGKEIKNDLQRGEFRVRLILGVTGSGKTEVYLEAMKTVLAQNGGVLFLVPEVALAPQTVSRLRHFFSGTEEEVVVWHSNLAAGERVDAWRRLRTGKAKIVVGARSAVFSPLVNLRLIIVDEEHESSYKQEVSPRYHGRDVAVYRAMLNRSTCILGSATPSLETMRNVELGKYKQSNLTKRVDGKELPLIHLVDMRRESQRKRTPSVISQPLLAALRQRYAQREQSILFLNRRGYNTTMLCPDCGYVEQCKQCSVALTYHRTDGFLKCHICGFRKIAPLVCPKCQSINLRKTGHGTQRLEDLVESLLPRGNKVVRVDTDMASKKNSLRSTLRDFRKGKIDVLVGTQMIAKGLDFPNVTLVGVIDADLPLRMEDFRASERAFQLIVQVSGRAGRGDRAGEVFVQSYAPHSPSIQFARTSDLHGFVEDELSMRKEFSYPPFRHLIRHLFKGRNGDKAEFYAQQWKLALEKDPIPGLSVRGPAPAPLEKVKGYYRHHLLYFTNHVGRTVREIKKRRDLFPIDREVQDVLDVDAHQIS